LVTATDAATGANVAAAIKIDQNIVGRSGVAFNFTFNPHRVLVGGRQGDVEIVYPTGSASAPGYRTSAIDFGFEGT
jgi:hypothetical protein